MQTELTTTVFQSVLAYVKAVDYIQLYSTFTRTKF
jgi:hypothetical protein